MKSTGSRSQLSNSAGADGLFYGNPKQFYNQIIAVLVTWIYCIVMSLIIIKVVDVLVGLRVTVDEEIEGLDSSQHGESGYNLEAQVDCRLWNADFRMK